MDALRVYEERGYTTQFGTREGGQIKCFTCGRLSDPNSFKMDSMRRIEGVSDPADEALVAALSCPECNAHGTCVMMYGTMAPPEDNLALRKIDDARVALQQGTWHREGWPEVGPPGSRSGGAGPDSP